MAIFSRKEKKTEDKKVEKQPVAEKAVVASEGNLASVLVKPRVTEKAVAKSEDNVYTFVVRKDANKHQIKKAIETFYNVTPVKINIVNKTPRQYLSRTKGRTITEKGLKKAYVYLKSGDSISLV